MKIFVFQKVILLRPTAVTSLLASRIRSGPIGKSGRAVASLAAAEQLNDPGFAKFRNREKTEERTKLVRVRRRWCCSATCRTVRSRWSGQTGIRGANVRESVEGELGREAEFAKNGIWSEMIKQNSRHVRVIKFFLIAFLFHCFVVTKYFFIILALQ